MATQNRDLFEDTLERLQPLGDVTGKAMFGGYGFWESGDMFGLISSDGTVYLKADDTTAARYAKAKAEQFAPEMSGRPAMAMPYWSVPASVLKSDAKLHEWAREAIAVGHATSKKKAKKGAAKVSPAPAKSAAKKATAKKSAAKETVAKKATPPKKAAKKR